MKEPDKNRKEINQGRVVYLDLLRIIAVFSVVFITCIHSKLAKSRTYNVSMASFQYI
jgi:surface polysaccharide O-acyltransferase-like enzyme